MKLFQEARSQSWLERYAVADNPATSPEIRQIRVQDTTTGELGIGNWELGIGNDRSLLGTIPCA